MATFRHQHHRWSYMCASESDADLFFCILGSVHLSDHLLLTQLLPSGAKQTLACHKSGHFHCYQGVPVCELI